MGRQRGLHYWLKQRRRLSRQINRPYSKRIRPRSKGAGGIPVEVPPERKLLICRTVRMWATPFNVGIALSIVQPSTADGRTLYHALFIGLGPRQAD